MREVHIQFARGGPETTLSESRPKSWMTQQHNLKSIIKDCIICRKLCQPPHTMLMADLPAERLKPFSPSFTVTSVDLFGPFNLKIRQNKEGLGSSVFSCATVCTIHPEIVEALSTPSFMHSPQHFAAHHGWPSTIISDNAKSFVGTEKELKKLVEEGRIQINKFAVLHRICWSFSTPLSPHQDRIYESLITPLEIVARNFVQLSPGLLFKILRGHFSCAR